jgi:hypothetical protein
MTHHNQINELTTWFLNLPLDESIYNKKHKVWSSNPKPHEAQLEDKKAKKNLRRSSRRRKNCKANKRHEKQQTKEKKQRKAQNRKTQNSPWNQLPLTLSMQAHPLRYTLSCFFSQLPGYQRVQPTLCPYSPPLAMNSSNIIREKNKILCLRFKIRVLHKAYKQVFK